MTDDGVGAKSDLATAFDRPFVRPTATSGSGSGLFVCSGLLRQMHGHIRLLGGTPSGSRCRIELPGAV